MITTCSCLTVCTEELSVKIQTGREKEIAYMATIYGQPEL
jgi:hypothetical protein